MQGERFETLCRQVRDWRHDLHRHPELAFEEHRSAGFVAEQLEHFGLEVHRGLAGTGVVGVLRRGSSSRSIGLRADLDALPIQETNDFAHRSVHPGRMHACGHDGHTAMLLGAARWLAEEGNFDGTVVFIFQPAEEAGGGGEVMIREGLFERFPVDAVYAVHNLPMLPAGTFGLRPGPIMAARDVFRATIRGRGAHGAMPHQGVDPLVVAAQALLAIQTIVSRSLDPLQGAVVSVTSLHGGEGQNVVPETAELTGGVRSLDASVRETIEQRLREILAGTCAAFSAEFELDYQRGYPPTVNDPLAVAAAAKAARRVVGPAAVDEATAPLMASEDFAYMLEQRPGAYVFLGSDGARPGEPPPCMLHNPGYDFNDEVLPLGVRFWISLVEQELATGGSV